MAKSTTGDTRWLEMHGGKWRVTLSVPKKLQGKVGATKVKLSLRTDSLGVANELKWGAIKQLKDRMRSVESSGGIIGNDRARVLQEASEIAARLKGYTSEMADDFLREVMQGRVDSILGTPVAHEVVDLPSSDGCPDGEQQTVEVYSPERKRLADQFVDIALNGRTPIAAADAAYKAKRLRVSPRTEDDHDRALRMLSAFCIDKGQGDDVASVDEYVATDFVAHLENDVGLAARTVKKYVSRLNLYFAYLKSLRQITTNPWRDVVVYMPTSKNSELERPFSEQEVVTLLTGPAKPAMRDLMMLGALTGARLDAIVDLKVGDIVDRKAFRFKAMKRESGDRYVPIHSGLIEIVLRRTEGKSPGDDFFPEYPVDGRNPLVERSFRASKHFTTYRRSVGVDDVVEGKRRSRVNYHSFRRWFTTKGERTDPPEGMIAALVGHARAGMTLSVYSEGPEMKLARKTIEKIKLPPLDGSPVVQPEAVTPRN